MANEKRHGHSDIADVLTCPICISAAREAAPVAETPAGLLGKFDALSQQLSTYFDSRKLDYDLYCKRMNEIRDSIVRCGGRSGLGCANR